MMDVVIMCKGLSCHKCDKCEQHDKYRDFQGQSKAEGVEPLFIDSQECVSRECNLFISTRLEDWTLPQCPLNDDEGLLCSVIEEHIDGSWWYHPGWTCDSEDEAKKLIEEKRKQEVWKHRPMCLFFHKKPFHQDRAVWTRDGESFKDRSGAIIWTKEKGQMF